MVGRHPTRGEIGAAALDAGTGFIESHGSGPRPRRTLRDRGCT